MKPTKIYFLSETAITIEWGNCISNAIYEQIRAFNDLLKAKPFVGLLETVPAYTTLTAFFRPEWLAKHTVNPHLFIQNYLEKLLEKNLTTFISKENRVSIPVCYDSEFGLDIQHIAEKKDLTTEEVKAIHLEQSYKVYMMGFLLGFPYMGEVDDRIAMPRKTTPRPLVEKGSVGIAGNQTGIYPLNSPAGWQIIGKTPLNLVDFSKENPFLLKTGDTVNFRAISKEEFCILQEKESEKTEEIIQNPALTVLKAGIFSTFQDTGRVGFRMYGVPSSGAMDTGAHHLANALLGNPKNTATIECTMGGFQVQFHLKTSIAVTGAGNLLINEKTAELYQVHTVSENDIVEIRFTNQGLRTYLAVKGGFASKSLMKSRSAVPKIKIGEVLKKGMGIGLEVETNRPIPNKIFQIAFPKFEKHKTIRIMEGQEIDWISSESRQLLYNQDFTLSNRCDRMGYLLEGKALDLAVKKELLSTAVMAGTIQLTPNGQMIILMNDCQTTGGYPRIGQVAAVDLPILAQLKPADTIDFQHISLEEATKLYLEQEQTIDEYFR